MEITIHPEVTINLSEEIDFDTLKKFVFTKLSDDENYLKELDFDCLHEFVLEELSKKIKTPQELESKVLDYFEAFEFVKAIKTPKELKRFLQANVTLFWSSQEVAEFFADFITENPLLLSLGSQDSLCEALDFEVLERVYQEKFLQKYFGFSSVDGMEMFRVLAQKLNEGCQPSQITALIEHL